MANHAANQINGTTFYEKNNHENEITSVELASEFGVSLESVKKLKENWIDFSVMHLIS
ncbi:hypothetical protein [Heyndrickxia ginsengihumi]|nr:hypothetical protein [Heyndrickxia ginsengihumi]